VQAVQQVEWHPGRGDAHALLSRRHVRGAGMVLLV
jgi:hypothetical protein